MNLNPKLSEYFKIETQAAAQKLLKLEKVFITIHSDTQVQSTIRSFSPHRVLLKAQSIEERTINASCNCKDNAKGKFCQHIFATLELLSNKDSDFLTNKDLIVLTASNTEIKTAEKPKNTEATILAKEKASAFRKAQYQKLKEIKKNQTKSDVKKSNSRNVYPQEVQSALDYFNTNGFPMPDGPDLDTLLKAKKSLARVFHPDKGGTHEETVELHRQLQILMDALKS